jgi:CheY-like chemotaxis protein
MVDDDPDGREAFAEFLRLHGFTVDDFDTAEEAIDSISQDLPAIVVMDINLSAGKMTGRDAVRRIRALPAAETLRLVAMTGHAAGSVDKEGLFDAVLTKPIDAEALVRVLKGLLAKGTRL